MYQEIVLSPLAFQDLEGCTSTGIHNICAALETEIILTDYNENILSEIAEVIENMSDPKFKGIFQLFIANINMYEGGASTKKTKTVKQKKRTFNELEKLRTELDLLRDNSACKILFTNKSVFDKHKRLATFYSFSVFILNDYSSTKEIYNLRIKSEKIVKNIGEEFRFINWIKKFIDDAERIEVKDPYLLNKFAFRDITQILKFAKPEILVKLLGYDDEARSKNHTPYNTEEDDITKFSILKKELSHITIEDNLIEDKDRKKLKERYLLTDRFSIDLGHALGSVRESDNIVVGGEIIITVIQIDVHDQPLPQL